MIPKAFAQIFQGSGQLDTTTGVTGIETALTGSGITQTGDFSLFLVRAINFILPYITLAAFVALVYAGVLYVTAFGNDEQLQKAKKIIMWALGGIVLVILSFTIVQFLTRGLVGGVTRCTDDNQCTEVGFTTCDKEAGGICK